MNMMKELVKRNTEENITVINITQFPEEALFGERIVILDKGKIKFDDHPHRVFQKVEALSDIDFVPPIEFLAYHKLKDRHENITRLEDLLLSPIL